MELPQNPPLIPGGIYRMTWEDSLRWVLAVDDVQVIYDVWSVEHQQWRLRTVEPPALMYKSFHHNFRELSEFVGYDELTPAEIEKFGLNLPMQVCRHCDLQWPSNTISNPADFAAHCRQYHTSLSDNFVLSISSVVLIPYDSVHGMGKGMLVTAQHEAGFTEAELLWQAHRIQQSTHHVSREGTGLHRQGWEQGCPSYYVGGYYDVAGYLKMQEELKGELPA